MWYPSNKKQLEDFIKKSFEQQIAKNQKILTNINGLIVPHAGYEYSGNIAGIAFSLLKNCKNKKAIIIGPSHYIATNEVFSSDKNKIETPLGIIKTFNQDFQVNDISKEHSINNQIPFLQMLGFKEIMLLMAGEINNEKSKEIAEKLSKLKDCIFIFSTDLSHFNEYNLAKEIDNQTIKIIESLDSRNFNKIDACGFYPLKILFHLCKILNAKPHLIEYKNSGDVTGEKSSVVGYASFWF